MRIAIIGGSGKLGSALAAKLSFRHEVIIGSRSKEKAERKSKELSEFTGTRVVGMENLEACKRADTAILTIPYENMEDLLVDLADPLSGKIVISSVVPVLRKYGSYFYASKTSAAEEVASLLNKSTVCSAFQTVPYTALNTKTHQVIHVPVASNTLESYMKVASVINSVSNLRSVYAGPLHTSRYIECLTVLLLNISKYSKIKSPYIRIVSS